MSKFFSDLNVWLALLVADHQYSAEAWNWLRGLPGPTLILCRYTQIGLLRLLTTPEVMGSIILTLRRAWGVYDRWIADPRVEYHPEPRGVDAVFRTATSPFAGKSVPKLVGDCYLLTHAEGCHATLVNLDGGLLALAARHGHATLRLSAGSRK